MFYYPTPQNSQDFQSRGRFLLFFSHYYNIHQTSYAIFHLVFWVTRNRCGYGVFVVFVFFDAYGILISVLSV